MANEEIEMRFATEYEHEMEATIELSERVKGALPSGCFGTETLVKCRNPVSLRLGFTNDPEMRDESGFYIEASNYHMLNEETDRGFHAQITFAPDKVDLTRIRDFLNYLIEATPSEKD